MFKKTFVDREGTFSLIEGAFKRVSKVAGVLKVNYILALNFIL